MRPLRTPNVALLAGLLTVHLTAARAADRNPQPSVAEVRILVLPEEEVLRRELKDPSDRAEFERIFWARRDPEPATPANEFQLSVARARARADELFTTSGHKGSDTDCGQLLVLLGEPKEVEGRELKVHFDAVEAMRGARRPEVWTYRSRPGDAVAFTAGELRVALDEECRFAEGARVREDLQRVARSKVVQPGLAYAKSPDGHLARLEDVRAALAAAPAPTAVDAPRTDFPLTSEAKMLLRTRSGEAYAAGLLRADLKGLPAGEGSPPAVIDATVVTQVVGAPAPAAARFERAVRGPVSADGVFTASYGVPLKPGRHVLQVSLVVGDKTAVTPVSVEVPDYDAAGLKLGSLLVYPEEAEAPVDAKDPDSAFAVGALHIHPRFGNVFAKTDALQAVCVLYGGEADAASGKPSLRARITFIRDGRPVAASQPEVFETSSAVVSVGPVALAGFAPGHYLARVEATDTVSGKSQAQETAFEIRP